MLQRGGITDVSVGRRAGAPANAPVSHISSEQCTAARLRRARAAIIREWEAKLPSQESVLGCVVPLLLDNLIGQLSAGSGENSRTESEMLITILHGKRSAAGADRDFARLLKECHLLRHCVLSFLEGDQSGGARLEEWERNRILSTIDQISYLGSLESSSPEEARQRSGFLPILNLTPASGRWLNLVLALIGTFLALTIAISLNPAGGSRLFALPLGMAIILTLYFGFTYGISSLLFSGVVLEYFFMRPMTSSALYNMSEPLQMAVYAFCGVIVLHLSASLRHAMQKLKMREDELKRSHDLLERRVQEKDTDFLTLENQSEMSEKFVATLTHDLRNPLTVAKTSAQLIIHFSDSLDRNKLLAERIIEGIDRADEMITNLLDANLIRAGEILELPMKPCDLVALSRKILDELATVHGDRFLLKSELLAKVHCSADGIRRVLENLITNAVKYGESQKPITVGLKCLATGSIQVSVHNHGPALSPEDQKAIFKYCRRSSTAVKNGKKGWGLGLTLVLGIAEAHGGSVSVESTQQEGTTFLVELPLVNRQESSTDAAMDADQGLLHETHG